MKKLKRHHKIEITAICLLLALSVAFVSFLSVHQFSSHELRVKYFFMEDENAIDVVNIGASEIYTGFSPEYIWHNYGITSYNLATAGAPMRLAKSEVKAAMETQNPKLMVISLNGAMYDDERSTHEGYTRMWLDNMPYSQLREEAIEEWIPEKDRINFRWKILNYHDNVARLTECLQLSWKEFKALNNRAKERELVSLKMDLKLAQQQSAADKDKIAFQNSWPDYTELLKGFTHIYIGEEHGTTSTPAETVRLLQALRKLHPDKRILLASEFSVTKKPNDYPLVQANEIHRMANLYPEVNQAADALNIDQLGLDSRYVSWEEDGHGSFLLIHLQKTSQKSSSKIVPFAHYLHSAKDATIKSNESHALGRASNGSTEIY